MNLETELAIKQAGQDIVQGTLLFACALVALPATGLTLVSSLLGGASEKVRLIGNDKEDGMRINWLTDSPVNILLSVSQIVGGPLHPVSQKEVESTPPQADEPSEEEVEEVTDDSDIQEVIPPEDTDGQKTGKIDVKIIE